MWASGEGHTKIVKLLLDAGADANAKTNYDLTVLMFASLRGYPEIVSLLLDSGADVNAKNNDGDTALTKTSKRGQTEIVKLIENHIKQENIKKANLVTKKGTTKDGRPLVPHSQKDIASHIASFAGGKRKTRKSKKSKKTKIHM